MPDDVAIIDMNSPKHVQMLMGWIKAQQGKGLHRVSIKRVRAQRSLQANAYYWAVVLPAVAAGLEEAWGESLSVEECHEWLKGRFNSQVIVDRSSGEVKGRRPCSTASLDTKEFSEYLDQVIRFAGEQLGVEVPAAESSPAAA